MGKAIPDKIYNEKLPSKIGLDLPRRPDCVPSIPPTLPMRPLDGKCGSWMPDLGLLFLYRGAAHEIEITTFESLTLLCGFLVLLDNQPPRRSISIIRPFIIVGTSSVGVLTSLFLVLAMANFSNHSGSAQASVVLRHHDGSIPPTNVPLDLIPEYFKLLYKCHRGGANTVRSLYFDSTCHRSVIPNYSDVRARLGLKAPA